MQYYEQEYFWNHGTPQTTPLSNLYKYGEYNSNMFIFMNTALH